MRRNGPLPLAIHAMLEPIVGLVFIVGPFVLGFDGSTQRTISVVIGALILVIGMTTRWRLSLVKLIPLPMHFAGDILIGIVSIVVPFVAGFSDDTTATVFFIVLGVGELGVALATAWRPPDEVPGEPARPGRYEPLSG